MKMVSNWQILVVACAIALPESDAGAGPPPYSASAAVSQQAYDFAQQYLNFPPNQPTPEQRNFVAFMLAFYSISEGVAQGMDFDHVYKTRNMLLTLGHLFPESSKEIIHSHQISAAKKIHPATRLIEELCPGVKGPICDRLIENQVRQNVFLQQPARILIQLGRMSELYRARERDIQIITKEGTQEAYLANNKYLLKPLILHEAEVMKLVQEL